MRRWCHWSSYSHPYTKGHSRTWLSMDFCKGQCYDGAGNMSGPCNGAAAIVRRQYPKAIYTHCMAHRLNLSVVSACKMQNVRNMFDTVREVTRSFEYSPQKEALLVQKVKGVCPESRRHTSSMFVRPAGFSV